MFKKMPIIFGLLVIFAYYVFNYNAYLLSQQWIKINTILTNKEQYSSTYIQHVNNIIYDNYEKWSFQKANEFKQFHKYKCRSILTDELKLYASFGLNKAITNYNPKKYNNTIFSSYARKYILGELYTGLSELQPLNNIKKYERRKGINKRKNNRHIQLSLSPKLLESEEEIFNMLKINHYNDIQNTFHNSQKIYHEIWHKIESMNIPNFTKKMIKLKFSYEFNKMRSNKQVATLMGCSEEWVRHNLAIFTNHFANHFNFMND